MINYLHVIRLHVLFDMCALKNITVFIPCRTADINAIALKRRIMCGGRVLHQIFSS